MMGMVSIAESLRRQRGEKPRKPSYYLTDIGVLNEIYQAAQAVVIQPDKFAMERLARVIDQAEGEGA
jgi:hypothetical protein